MNIPDLINALFEVVSGSLVWLNVRAILRDKTIRGVSVAPITCFVLWGFWNLYYYPHLDQWFSFVGGLSVATANTAWLVLIIYYGKR